MTDTEKLKIFREKLVEMLDCFVKICDENNLVYWLAGGTLLGGVRHKGFIPWDDDIDVSMPREDYERFCAIAPTTLPSHLFFQSVNTEKRYPMLFSKIRYNNTFCKESGVYNTKSKKHNGIYIDIFPYDGCPDDKAKVKKVIKKMNFYGALYFLKEHEKIELHRHECFKLLLKKLLRHTIFPFIPKKYLLKKFSHIQNKYKFYKSNYVTCYFSHLSKECCSKKSVYVGEGGQLGKVEFCGKIYNAPNKTDEHLTALYGDYMTLPPKDKQKRHFNLDDMIV